jgi:taurine dioxygenase
MPGRNFDVRPMPVGAEIIDLDMSLPIAPETQSALYDAWLQHGILLFTGLETTVQHLALSRCFGELELHPIYEVRSKEDDLLIDIGGPRRGPAYVYDERDLRVSRIPFHRDTAYTPDICKGAMLRMLEVPVNEGETMLCDTAKAYDALPQSMKDRLEGLEYKATLRLTAVDQTRPGAFWKTARIATREEDPDGGYSDAQQPSVKARYPSVIQPAVLTHPESGRKCIFLSPTYVDRFIGLSQDQSDELLNYLVDHQVRPEFIYKHKWRINDAIVWDNRRFMHAGMGNHPDEKRWGVRTTLAGAVRTGRYFEEASAVA